MTKRQSTDKVRGRTFEQWLSIVDRQLREGYGVTVDELGEWRYVDAWAEGMNAAEAAKYAYCNAARYVFGL